MGPSRTALVAALALSLPPASAHASHEVVEPGSPPSVEYELPYDGARERGAGGDGSPHHDQRADGGGAAPLFGAGVERDGGGRGGGVVAGNSPSAGSSAAGAPLREVARSEPGELANRAGMRSDAGADGQRSAASTLVWFIALVLAVAGAGVATGVALRRLGSNRTA